MKKMIILYIILSVLFFGFMLTGIKMAVDEIHEVGLKNIVHEIWEDKQE